MMTIDHGDVIDRDDAGDSVGTIPTPIVGSTTGTISPLSPLGSASTTVCSSTPGGPPTNGAALPFSISDVPNSPSPGTIQPAVTQLAGTGIDPTTIVMPTPNTSACAESMTMNLATPGTMAPANATVPRQRRAYRCITSGC